MSLEERVLALEQTKITLADLPLAALMRKLESLGELSLSALDDHPLGGNFVQAAGPINSAAPATATDGSPFTVQSSGIYLCLCTATAFSSTVATRTVSHYIDSVVAAVNSLVFNVTTTHLTFPLALALRSLAAGTHYWWPRGSAGISSDSTDTTSLAVIRVA